MDANVYSKMKLPGLCKQRVKGIIAGCIFLTACYVVKLRFDSIWEGKDNFHVWKWQSDRGSSVKVHILEHKGPFHGHRLYRHFSPRTAKSPIGLQKDQMTHQLSDHDHDQLRRGSMIGIAQAQSQAKTYTKNNGTIRLTTLPNTPKPTRGLSVGHAAFPASDHSGGSNGLLPIRDRDPHRENI